MDTEWRSENRRQIQIGRLKYFKNNEREPISNTPRDLGPNKKHKKLRGDIAAFTEIFSFKKHVT